MIADEEDIIVEEIPVFLTKNLQDGLFVLQFPTKIRVGSFEKLPVLSSNVKPLNQEVKVEYGLDTSSPNFDSFRAQQLTAVEDAKGRNKTERTSSTVEAQSYTSTRLMNDSSKYVVGVYSDKEMHLTPVKNILQMRPAFPHFDKEDKRPKFEQKKANDIENEKEEELQQVTVKFARAGSSKQKSKEKPDLASFLKQRKEEPWRKTQWYSRSSNAAEIERQKLYTLTHEISSALAMDTYKYAKKLLPCQPKSNYITEDQIPLDRSITKNNLKEMSILEQLKTLLRDVKMMSTTEIVEFLHDNVDKKITYDKVLRSLTQVGTLLHGNWVPQSEIIYRKETVSNLHGVSSELMARARDYVIFKFSRNPYLYRPEIISTTRLPPQEATEVLNSVARVNSEKKWELLLPPDTKFIERHPDLVERQKLIWRTTENIFNDVDGEKSPKRIRKRSLREVKPQLPVTQTQQSSDQQLTSELNTNIENSNT